MEYAYLEWENAARQADNAEQAVARLTRLGLPAPMKLLDQLASLESELLVKLHALQNSMPRFLPTERKRAEQNSKCGVKQKLGFLLSRRPEPLEAACSAERLTSL